MGIGGISRPSFPRKPFPPAFRTPLSHLKHTNRAKQFPGNFCHASCLLHATRRICHSKPAMRQFATAPHADASHPKVQLTQTPKKSSFLATTFFDEIHLKLIRISRLRARTEHCFFRNTANKRAEEHLPDPLIPHPPFQPPALSAAFKSKANSWQSPSPAHP